MKKNMPGVDSKAERGTFGRNFHQARIKLRLRQRDIYLITGIAQSHISEIEKGECNIAIDTMVKLAHVVKVPLWRLFKPSEVVELSEEELDEVDPRRAPRSQRFHEEKVRGLIFEFTDDEMRMLRAAAADSAMTVTDYLRHLLQQHSWKPIELQRSAKRSKRSA
jgi:transcriptional regulator with XRE-family HTH domain